MHRTLSPLSPTHARAAFAIPVMTPHFLSSAQASPLSFRLPCQLDISTWNLTAPQTPRVQKSPHHFLQSVPPPRSASQLKAPSTPDPSSSLMLGIQPQGVSVSQQQGCHPEAHLKYNSRAAPDTLMGACTLTRCPGNLCAVKYKRSSNNQQCFPSTSYIPLRSTHFSPSPSTISH